jgi:small subunit ribosomal protein S7
MPRKGNVPKRDVLPDPIYNSKLVTKIVNTIMKDGKKGIAQTIFYDAMNIVKEKTNTEPMEVLDKALENIMPQLEVKSRRVGGANYQVPIEVKADRKQALGIRWLINYARLRGGHSMADNLANEIIDASNGTGAAVKKREETHRMAEANKAFAHYRW